MNSKICTSLEQSKKLLELGIDRNTADMYHHYDEDFGQFDLPQIIDDGEGSFNTHHILFPKDIPAWSLTALLEVLPDELEEGYYLTLNKEGKEYCCCYEDNNGNSFKHTFADNPVDACYEMILKLHELKML